MEASRLKIKTGQQNFADFLIRPQVALFLILLFASYLSITNARTYSHTTDEPVHIAAGLELLNEGQYTLELQHPPLARIASALIPYIYNYEFIPGETIWDSAKKTLYQDQPDELINKSRLGILPFLWILVAYVYLWAKYLSNTTMALVAAATVAFSPVILAHSGLATLDIAATAIMTATLYYFHQFLARPSYRLAVLFVVFNALSICTKFSAIPFLATAYTSIIAVLIITQPKIIVDSIKSLPVSALAYLPLVFFTVCWACYGFDFISLSDSIPDFARKFEKAETRFSFIKDNSSLIHFISNINLPSPLVSIPAGIIHVAYHNSEGHESYLLGETSTHGWWYFYFVSLVFKSTISFLILSALSIPFAIYSILQNKNKAIFHVPLIAVLGVLLFASTYSNINIGVRHILIAYPLLAIVVVNSLNSHIFSKSETLRSFLAAFLVTQTLFSAVYFKGSYLSYFNILSGNEPSNILMKSDFEWGQDLRKLRKKIAKHDIALINVGIEMSLATDFKKSLGIEVREIEPENPVSGWVATSTYWNFYHGVSPSTCLRVLDRAGKTITLYYSEEEATLSQCSE